jgi:hypothetical protein
MMALDANTSGFGKREIHRVWTERGEEGEQFSISGWRAWAAVALLALAAIVLGRTAALLATGGPISALGDLPAVLRIFLALAASVLGLVSLAAASRVVRLAVRRGPVLRLEPSRIVLRAPPGHVVLNWEDVRLKFSLLFLRVGIVRSHRQAGAEMPREILVPVLLLPGGAAGLRDAIRRVRPGALPAQRR